MLYAIVGILVIILDQGVKYWVTTNLMVGTVTEPLIPGVLSLVRLHNDGAAFSFLAGGGARIYFIILTAVFTIAVPTTAGTAAEVTINYVITDPEKVRKFVCVDTNDAPEVAVVDPDMMASMPAGLTASTGMDALTHAIEGYTTKGAWELSDMFHFEAIKLISENLRDSVAEAKSGQPGSGREGMALGQYVAGMGFSNVGLGIDHAMAHTLSAHYDTPHGVACAMLLPIAMEFNKPVCAERLAKVAVAMGVDTTGMSTDEAADAAIAAVKQLSADVNIPHVCEAMKADEIEVLAKDAMADACFPGNPREATLDDVIELFKKICPAA